MKCAIVAASIFLFSCIDHDVTGHVTADPLDIGLVQAELKQVDGIFYIRESVKGWTKNCISLDPSTDYPNTWQPLKTAEHSRQSEYTFEEIENCK